MKRSLAAITVLAAIASPLLLGTASARRPAASTAKAKLALRHGKLGTFLVDGKGLTLYLFQLDKGTTSHCNDGCAKVWAPLLSTGRASAAPGVDAAKIGTTRRKDGTLQVTYGGHPLYHYDDDHKPGQTEGQGSTEFGAKWYVLAASGNKIDDD